MPTISIFFGVVVQMYWRDHPPPHYHAYYQGHEALISINTGDAIARSLPCLRAMTSRTFNIVFSPALPQYLSWGDKVYKGRRSPPETGCAASTGRTRAHAPPH